MNDKRRGLRAVEKSWEQVKTYVVTRQGAAEGLWGSSARVGGTVKFNGADMGLVSFERDAREGFGNVNQKI